MRRPTTVPARTSGKKADCRSPDSRPDMTHTAFVACSTLLVLPLLASAQGASKEAPLLGTWHLNVAKSTYKPGPPPKSQTRIYQKHRFGIEATVRTVQAD